MRYMILAGLALSALAAAPAAAAPAPALLLDADAAVLEAATAAQSGGVQVWMDRDLFGLGDRMRVRVRTDRDAYLAVFHIDTNGDVDVIFPRYDGDDGWVQGGRTLNLGSRGGVNLNVRGGYGMGYVMAVALDEPLEMWRVRDLYRPRLASWDGDRSIYGDPFYAMDEIVRAVVPEPSYGFESVDYYTYHVGNRRYDYPRYACYDGYGDWYHDSRYDYYGRSRCDRVRVILVHRPYYYDTYRWRGGRRPYYDRYYYRTARNRPLHGYKERTDGQAPPVRTTSARRPGASGAPEARGGTARTDRPASARPSGGGASGGGTSAERPQTGGSGSRGGVSSVRRPESGGSTAPADRPTRGTYEPRVRDRSEGRGTAEPRARDAGSRGGPSQPRQPEESVAQPPQQDKPVAPARERPTFQRRPAESPPQRSAEPRRESPPQRQAEPRRESPPQRQAQPRRESPPSRQSAPPRSSSSPPSRESSGSASRPRSSDN